MNPKPLKECSRFTAIILLLTSLLGLASPLFWIFGLLDHFRIQDLIAGLIITTLGIALRNRTTILCALITLTLNSALILPTIYKHKNQPTPTAKEFSVLTYNVWRRNPTIQNALPVIQTANADITYLTEVTPALRQLLPTSKTIDFGQDVLLFAQDSDITIIQSAPAPQNIGSGIQAQLHIAGKPVSLLALHLPTPLGRERSAQRQRAFAAITHWLQSQPHPAILIGDLNATPWSHEFRALTTSNALSGHHLHPTWPYAEYGLLQPLLRIPIDHCLHTAEIHTLENRTLDTGGSNHRPILRHLSIP